MSYYRTSPAVTSGLSASPLMFQPSPEQVRRERVGVGLQLAVCVFGYGGIALIITGIVAYYQKGCLPG